MKIDNKSVTTIGITGTIGAGKSTVGKILAQQNIPVIDTDRIAHDLLNFDHDVKKMIKMYFPGAIKKLSTEEQKEDEQEEQIDRKELGKIIFKDNKAKSQLETILHPRIRQICREQTAKLAAVADTPPIIATLVPLLFEANRQADYDQTWVVITDEKLLRKRLTDRDHLSAQEIDLRLAGQMSQQEKAKLADKVLDNSGNEDQLRKQVLQLLANLH